MAGAAEGALQEQSSWPDQTTAGAHAEAGEGAGARALLLEEMQRRDPAGFARWLADGPTDPPEQHIRGDQGLAA